MRTLARRSSLRVPCDDPDTRRSPSPSSASSRSASAPTPRSSASSTRSCCGRCLSRSRNVWCGSSPRRRPGVRSSCRRASSIAGSKTRTRSREWRCTASGSSRSAARAPHGRSKPEPSARASSRSFAPGRRSDASSGRRRTHQAARYVAILSDRFWKSELGGAADVVGRTLRLNEETYTIVGVMPPSASVASWAVMACDIWVPIALTDEQRASRGNHNQQGVARLRGDVELARRAVRNGCDVGAARARVPEVGQGLGSAGRSDAGGDRRRQPHDAGHAARRGRPGPAHRLRQRRQPALHARSEPAQGDRDPLGARRGTRTRVSAAAGRSAVACGRRRRARPAARVWNAHVGLDAARQPGAEGGGNLDRCARAAVRVGGVDAHGHARRHAAGAARGPRPTSTTHSRKADAATVRSASARAAC